MFEAILVAHWAFPWPTIPESAWLFSSFRPARISRDLVAGELRSAHVRHAIATANLHKQM